jgi:predicted dehydrogenase
VHVRALRSVGTTPAAVAGSAGVVATVPFVYRYYPMVRDARARVLAGETGRLIVA